MDEHGMGWEVGWISLKGEKVAVVVERRRDRINKSIDRAGHFSLL